MVVEEVQVGLDFERSSAAGAAARVLTSCYLFAMSRSGDELFLDRKFYQYLQDHLHQVIVLVRTNILLWRGPYSVELSAKWRNGRSTHRCVLLYCPCVRKSGSSEEYSSQVEKKRLKGEEGSKIQLPEYAKIRTMFF